MFQTLVKRGTEVPKANPKSGKRFPHPMSLRLWFNRGALCLTAKVRGGWTFVGVGCNYPDFFQREEGGGVIYSRDWPASARSHRARNSVVGGGCTAELDHVRPESTVLEICGSCRRLL